MNRPNRPFALTFKPRFGELVLLPQTNSFPAFLPTSTTHVANETEVQFIENSVGFSTIPPWN